MKILYVITKATWGGSQRYVYDLITEAKRRGYEPMLAFGVRGLLAEKAEAAGSTLYEVPGLARDISLADDWRAFKSLSTLFAEVRPDMVHLNGSKAGFLAALAARQAKVSRVIFTAHGWAFTEPRSPLSKLVFGFAHYLTALLSDTVIANSEATYRHARGWWFVSQKLVLIPLGIESFPFGSRTEARKALAERDPTLAEAIDRYWVGTIAELHRSKGLDTGIEAWHKAKLPGHWIVIGAGEEERMLRARARNHTDIHFVGFLKHAETYLAAFDAFLLPSRNESAGYVLLEAGIVGLPVIATDAGGIPGIVGDGAALAEANNGAMLADRLMETYYSESERARLSKKLHERVLKEFNLGRMLDATFATYSPE